MPEVPARKTKHTFDEISNVLAKVKPGLSRQQRAHVLALMVHESGRCGKRAICPIQHNVGNIAVPESRQNGAVEYWRPPWFDPGPHPPRLQRLHELMLDGREPSAFRAYTSLTAGVLDLMRVLESPRMRSMLTARTPDAFLEARRDTGYTPALDVQRSLPGFTHLVQEFGGSGAGKGGSSALLAFVVAVGYILSRFA